MSRRRRCGICGEPAAGSNPVDVAMQLELELRGSSDVRSDYLAGKYDLERAFDRLACAVENATFRLRGACARCASEGSLRRPAVRQ